MNTGQAVKILAERDDYFAAALDNGGVRIGLKGCQSINYPSGHSMHSIVMAATDETVEAVFDKAFEFDGLI